MKPLLRTVAFAAALLLPFAPVPAAERGAAEHVVIVVWDGMRPDFITPQYTPNLHAMASGGVFFKNHHAAYISSTEVNGTTIATGMQPDRNGIYANNDYRPHLSLLSTIATEGLDAVRRGDLLSGGHYLTAPTLAEILQSHGFPTVTAGAKPVVFLHDRSAKRDGAAQKDSPVLFAGQTIPKSWVEALMKVNDDKKFPSSNSVPNSPKDLWTTHSVTKSLWKKGVPKYTLLWLSDPDATQHAEGVGHDKSLEAIAHSDKCLGEVIAALDEKKIREKTDILVVSDHGFSTIRRGPDVVEALKRAKFKATRKFEDPEPGEILVIGHGGSSSFYVQGQDPALIRRLTEFLQGCDFAGVLFSRTPQPGTFPLEAARLGLTNVAPDLIMAVRWSHDLNEHGFPGLFTSDGGSRGKGSHASLSRYDMNNTLVAAGPDFKRGLVNGLPSGNADLAPTVLWILGVPQPVKMDGRVLHEALATSTTPVPEPKTETLEATHDIGPLQWRQYLKFTRVGDALYFNEGNGGTKLR